MHPKEKTKTITVTPEQAKEWIQNNFRRNRPITWSRVVYFRDQIREGKFKCISQGITFTWHGDLLDGQHRLMGIIEAGVPVKMKVFFGEDPANFYLYDDNKPKSVGDILSSVEVKNGKLVAAIFKKVLDIAKTNPEGYSAMGHRKWKVYSRRNAMAWAKDPENEKIIGEVTEYLSDKTNLAELRTTPSIIGAMYFVFSRYNLREARTFFRGLKDGVNLPGDSPVLWCRKTLMTLRDDYRRQVWHTAPQHLYQSVIIRAWNDWMGGEQVSRKYDLNIKSRKFPIINDVTKRAK